MSEKSSVKQSDVEEIITRINIVIKNMGYQVMAYDNTGSRLNVFIEGDKGEGE